MTRHASPDSFGQLTEPTTVKIQRLLPGPIETVWSFLVDSDKRRKWLAAGDMDLHVGAPFKLTWRNDELTDPPGQRPEGFGTEHSMDSRITELDAPRRLAFAWGEGDVTFTLEPQGEEVLLTLVHRRLMERPMRLMVSAGWHAHLDILATRLSGGKPEPFWDAWQRLKQDYDRRIPA